MSLMSLTAALLFLGAIKQAPEVIPPLRPPRAELAPRAVKSELWPWLAVLGGAGVALVLAWPRRVRGVAGEPAIVRARRELARAGGSAAIGDVMRRYVGSVFELPGQGQTGEEILAYLALHPRWRPELTAGLAAFFSAVETMKFAPASQAESEPAQRGTGAPLVVVGQAGCLSHDDRRGACPTTAPAASQLRDEASALLAELEALRTP